MVNERKTEDLVDNRLREKGYYLPGSGIIIEKQKSDTPRIQKLLANASKKGTGVGKPEFLIHSTSHPDFMVVIECKADPQYHISTTLDRYADYAVDSSVHQRIGPPHEPHIKDYAFDKVYTLLTNYCTSMDYLGDHRCLIELKSIFLNKSSRHITTIAR